MLRRLLDRLARVERRMDPQLGPILYQARAGFWEARVPFGPVGATLELLLDGDASGPSPGQRSWLSELRVRYPALEPLLFDALRAAGARPPFILGTAEVPVAPTDEPVTLAFEDATGEEYEIPLVRWLPGAADHVPD